MSRSLFSVIDDVADLTDEVLIFFSGGLDSVVCLELCKERFKRITLAHLYTLPDLSFQSGPCRAYAERYGCNLVEAMHPDIVTWLNIRNNAKLPKMRMADSIAKFRADTGVDWCIFGFRREDSVGRSIRMTKCSGIDMTNRHAFPLMDWNRKKCHAFLRQRRVYLPRHYTDGFRDIHTFKGESILYIAHNYPEDYAKICKAFPWVEGEYVKALAES